MRTIKFRAQKKTNGVWIYGSLVYSNEIDAAIYFQTGNGSVKAMEWVYIIPETIGQFTELFDKNGKEIYEGDIIRFVNGQKKVNGEWVADEFIYTVEYSEGTFYGISGLSKVLKSVEVIGNIHDNPSLLKGGGK